MLIVENGKSSSNSNSNGNGNYIQPNNITPTSNKRNANLLPMVASVVTATATTTSIPNQALASASSSQNTQKLTPTSLSLSPNAQSQPNQNLALVLPSEEFLYQKYDQWFRQQRKSLLSFLVHSVGNPKARFPLPLPSDFLQIQIKVSSITAYPAHLIIKGKETTGGGKETRPVAQTRTVYLSRGEIFLIMAEYIGQMQQAGQEERKALLAANMVSVSTQKLWAKQKLYLHVSTRHMLAVYSSLTAGLIDAQTIANKLDRSQSCAQTYRQCLLDAVFFNTFAQVLLRDSSQTYRQTA